MNNEHGLKKQFDQMMNEALIEAKKAMQKNNVPIGAIILKDNEIIARAHNNKFWHAEILCIQKAQKKMITLGKELSATQLMGTTIFVTIEPCPMCIHAIKLARINLIVFGATNTRECLPEVEIVEGVKESEAKTLMKEFFVKKRTENMKGYIAE